MSTTSPYAPSAIRAWKWSPAEKSVAHKAFDKALKHELDQVMQKGKERAARIREPSQLWDLESWLGKRRREIDETYDFRYSVLPMVFARLLRDGRIEESDLTGLAQDKLDSIRFLDSR